MVEPQQDPASGLTWHNGRISLKEHYDALRAADEKLREAVRLGDSALQAERDRRYSEKEADRGTALAAALLAVKERNEAALAALATATAVLAKTTVADKAAANEWRGTVNDIISKMGGARMLWGAIAGLIGLGLLIYNSTRNIASAPTPVTVEQPLNAPVPVKPVP